MPLILCLRKTLWRHTWFTISLADQLPSEIGQVSPRMALVTRFIQ
jgi:hypothetical protein